MGDQSIISIALEYFSASNQRDFSKIENLLHSESSYSSDTTGLYFGQHNIMAMMFRFYEAFPYLHWQIDAIQEIKENIVEILFTLTMRDINGTENIRKGRESIIIVQNHIRHIEVCQLS